MSAELDAGSASPFGMTAWRRGLSTAVVLCGFGLAACQTSTTSNTFGTAIDRSAGSAVNIASLTAVIEGDPSDANAYNVRGSAYGQAGDFRRAVEDFNKAIEINPTFFQAYANRALVYRRMGRDDQVKFFAQTLEWFSQSP